MATCDEFSNLSVDALTRLLADDRVSLKEEVVWQIGFTWLQADQAARSSNDFERVFGCVRFALMGLEAFQKCAIQYGVQEVQVVKEAKTYLTAMEFMDQDNAPLHYRMVSAQKLRTSFKETPAFASPRIPKNFLITLGGFLAAPISDVGVYDPTSNRWSSLPVSLPQGLAYSTAQCLGNKIFLMGGVTIDQPTEELEVVGETRMLRSVVLYEIGDSSVKNGVTMKKPRAFAASAQVGSTIFVFGGRSSPDSPDRLKACEKLDTLQSPMNWERVAPMESGRADAGAVVVGGKVMVVGGFSGTDFLSSVEIYNPSDNTWQSGPSLPAPRSGMGVAALDGTVYVAGGNRGTGRLCSVDKLMPGANR